MTDRSMRVSVVMTTFNGAEWLPEQLQSIANQTVPIDEIVVCDDGSTDRTLDIVKSWNPPRSERILLEADGSPVGTVANLERGLRHTTGDVVILSDQDDVWTTTRVERNVSHLTDSDSVAMVFSDGNLIGPDGLSTGGSLWQRAGFDAGMQRRFESDPVGALLARSFVTGATTAIRRESLDMFLPIETPWWHDAWFALIAAGMGERVVAAPMRLIDYRLHGNNVAGLPDWRPSSKLSNASAEQARHLRMEGHYAAAAARLHALGADAHTVSRIRAAAEFWRQRCELQSSRSLPQVARLLRSGGYGRYAGGVRSALYDAVLARRRR